jgi:uncharacterized lipoprotein
MAISACSGEGSLRCEDSSFYATSSTVPPVRVPDGLSVPDESQALQIPPGDPLPVTGEDAPPSCLEQPPDFFEEEAED